MLKVASVIPVSFNGGQVNKNFQASSVSAQNNRVSNVVHYSKVPLATLQAYSANVSFQGGAPITLKTVGMAKPVDKLMEEYGGHIIKNIREQLRPRFAKRGQFLNWKGLLLDNQLYHMDKIYENAATLKANGVTEKLGVIGIGGSAHTIEAVGGLTGFNKKTEVLTSVVDDEIATFVEKLGDLHTAGIMVVSKSGTTPEPSYGFQKVKQAFEKFFVKDFLEAKGFDTKDVKSIPREDIRAARIAAKEAVQKRIMVVTDADAGKSTLRQIVNKEGYLSDVISDDVGGRYGAFDNHVLTAMALEGMPKEYMRKMLEGAKKGQSAYFSTDMSRNLAAQKAAYIVDEKLSGRSEFFTYYTGEKFKGMGTWAKQLYSESLKSELTPATDIATAVQHYRAEADCHEIALPKADGQEIVTMVPASKRGFYDLVKTDERNSTFRALIANIEDYYPRLQPMMITTLPRTLSPETIGRLLELDYATILHTGALLRTMKGETWALDKALPEVTQPNVEKFKDNGREVLAKLKEASKNN